MLPRILLVTSLALFASAAPTATSTEHLVKRDVSTGAGPYSFTPELAAFYAAVSQEISKVKSSSEFAKDIFSCDASKAAANFPAAPTELPAPAEGAQLKHVLLGMGTQNYSCPIDGNSTAAPTQLGAYAVLFNITCIAANYPDILDILPPLAYKYPLPSVYFPAPGTVGLSAGQIPSSDFKYQPLNILFSGIHTFYNLTTPRFDMTFPNINEGIIYSKKVANSTAWSNATHGANGAVPYLKLDTLDTTIGGYTNVYRMQTQGGAQPKTCGNLTGEFTEPYSATYWFYGK